MKEDLVVSCLIYIGQVNKCNEFLFILLNSWIVSSTCAMGCGLGYLLLQVIVTMVVMVHYIDSIYLLIY